MLLQFILKFLFIYLFTQIVIYGFVHINNKPILLFPGIGGSRLIKNKISHVWPPSIYDILFKRNKWSNDIKINYNETNFEPFISSDIRIVNFNNKETLQIIPPGISKFIKNPYDNLFNTFTNIHPMPYDFRLMHSESYLTNLYQELTSYIESFNEPIVAITHSCGGILFHNFLCQKNINWKNKYIKSVININVPFGGSLNSLIHCTMDTFTNLILTKEVIQSFGGIILIHPNNIIYDIDKNLDNKYPNISLIKKIHNKNHHLISNLFKSNGVNTKIIYSTGKSTPIEIKLIKNEPKIIYGDGDGCVGLKSLLVPKIWNNKNIEFFDIENYEHTEILNSDELIKIISSFV
jgi:hypothetical protein